MANKIILRRDTTVNWNTANPILSSGEIGLDISTGKFRIGNGVDEWIELSEYARAQDIADDYNEILDAAVDAATAAKNAAIAQVTLAADQVTQATTQKTAAATSATQAAASATAAAASASEAAAIADGDIAPVINNAGSATNTALANRYYAKGGNALTNGMTNVVNDVNSNFRAALENLLDFYRGDAINTAKFEIAEAGTYRRSDVPIYGTATAKRIAGDIGSSSGAEQNLLTDLAFTGLVNGGMYVIETELVVNVSPGNMRFGLSGANTNGRWIYHLNTFSGTNSMNTPGTEGVANIPAGSVISMRSCFTVVGFGASVTPTFRRDGGGTGSANDIAIGAGSYSKIVRVS